MNEYPHGIPENNKEYQCLECEGRSHLYALKHMDINNPTVCSIHLRNALCFILEALNWEEESK